MRARSCHWALSSWRHGSSSARSARDSGADPATPKPPPPWELRQNSPGFMPGVFTVPPPPKVPSNILRPAFADDPNGRPRPPTKEEYAQVKSSKQIAKMRTAGRLAAEALWHGCEAAKEGVNTAEVDRIVCEFIMAKGGYPVGINYHGFPRGICASVNEVALHGIPNTRPLESGDIVNFDVVAFYDGAYGDCSRMVCVGNVDDDARRLCDTTKELLDELIKEVGPGQKLNALGDHASKFARERGYGIVSEYCGHFIGEELHMKPNVLFVPNANALELREGNTFTIEPILIEGGGAQIEGPREEDGWTIVSKNGAWSAQWEHTVLVTEHGAEILTLPG